MAVVLAVTGAEALYADLGHFGRKPIIRICDVARKHRRVVPVGIFQRRGHRGVQKLDRVRRGPLRRR
jgi:K+ potassium transporter